MSSLGARVTPADSLADEGPLGDGLQGADPPAHLGCSVELQAHPGGGRQDGVGAGNLGGGGALGEGEVGRGRGLERQGLT